jgi:hypothetical protein
LPGKIQIEQSFVLLKCLYVKREFRILYITHKFEHTHTEANPFL